jgi:hypothetical protein
MRLAAELRRHVVQLAEEIGERNLQRRPRQLAQALASVYDVVRWDYLTAREDGFDVPIRGTYRRFDR